MNDSIQVITPYILKKKSIKKVKYNSFTKDYIILDSLVNDLKSFLDDFIPKTISLEISNNTKEVFNYYLKNKVEEVLLFFTEENNKIGIGLAGYSSTASKSIMGHKSDEIANILSYSYREEMIHKDDLVLL